MAPNTKTHVVLFPFMSKGHTIPLIHLAQFLLRRDETTVTFITTPGNLPFISESVSGTNVSITEIPFPQGIPEIPPGVESTDKFPSMSLFVPFCNATKQMQPHFEKALEKLLPHVTCIISDGFLHWTLESASKYGVPRLCFYGMSHYAMVIHQEVVKKGLVTLHESADEPFTVPSFPWIKLTRNDFSDPFDKIDPRGPHLDFITESNKATLNSFGIISNTFYELEPLFVDYWNRECKPKSYCVGPFCLAQAPKRAPMLNQTFKWIEWLDQKLAQGSPVLYVAFGSQAEVSPEQLREIAFGFEESRVNFLWVLRKSGEELDQGFENRVKERGLIVKEWVDQKHILEHKAVWGFVSHCGWNSVLESICAEVPILAWPMMAEQHLNARMVTEEIKIGLRVKTVNGSVKGFVKGESLKDSVVELMEGEKGKELRKKVKEVAAAARKAVEDGGSSCRALNQLLEELHSQQAV